MSGSNFWNNLKKTDITGEGIIDRQTINEAVSRAKEAFNEPYRIEPVFVFSQKNADFFIEYMMKKFNNKS